ncbi:hypothetical protein I656_02335 [Geobacillus sp. WSUCF1]|nr:hypothetical protein I656_02335 [Geobacillus sp. WSUCF1]
MGRFLFEGRDIDRLFNGISKKSTYWSKKNRF